MRAGSSRRLGVRERCLLRICSAILDHFPEAFFESANQGKMVAFPLEQIE